MNKRWIYLLVAISIMVVLLPSDWADDLAKDWKVVDNQYLSSRDVKQSGNIPIAEAAAAQGLYAEGIGVTASSTSWVTVATIAAGSFTASKNYLIYANAMISNNNATSEARIRLVHGGTPTVFTDASAAYELTAVAAGTGNRTNYSYMTVFAQPATAELVRIEISNSSTNTTTAELGQIFALKLSDDFTQNTDWCYAEDTDNYTTEAAFSDTSSTDAASCSLTANGSDDYLAIASAIVDITSTNSQYRMSLYESVTNVDLPVIDIEGEDATNEFRGHTLTQTYAAPSAASHLWQPRFNDESTAYTILSSRIFVINLAKFNQHAYSYITDEEAPAGTPSWTTTRTIAPTPSVTGDWFIFGSFGNDVGALTNDLFTRLQINAAGGGLVSNPAYGDDAPHEDSWDATDVTGFNIFKMVSLSSGGARTINLDVQMNSGTTLRVQERHLVAFSLELYVPPVYSPEMNNWRWYGDEADAAVDTPYAAENTAPPQIENGKSIPYKLRINLTETGGVAENDSRKVLQYSTSTLGPWTLVGSTSDTLFLWRFYDGGGTDGAAIPSEVLSDSSAANLGTHNEASSTGQTNSDHPASTTVEWEFSIENYNAVANTTYYFNIRDEVLAADIPLASGKNYPSLKTATAYTLTLNAPTAVYLGSWVFGSSAYASYAFVGGEEITIRDNRGVTSGNSAGWSCTAAVSLELQYTVGGSWTILDDDTYWISDVITGLFAAPTTNISTQSGSYMGSAVTAASVAGSGKDGLGGFTLLPTMRMYNVPHIGDYAGQITITLV